VKKLLVFLVLLGIGMLALRLSIGDEAPVRANGSDKKEKQERRPDGPPGVNIAKDRVGARVSQNGPLHLPSYRKVPLDDGRVLQQLVYMLDSKDSLPVGEGLQQLVDVTLELYDDGVHTATVVATEAFIELGLDANGNATFDEQKEIDLRNVVVTTTEASKLAGARLSLGDARVNVDDNAVQLTTTADQPVELVMAGEQNVTMRGKGAKARLPRKKTGGLQKTSIEILSDPVLESDGVRVRARGRLHFVEDAVAGTAQITIDDDVQLDLDNAQLSFDGLLDDGSERAARSSVRGDQFTGWLVRDGSARGDAGQRAMLWRRLLLVGAPATIDVPGVHVDTPRLSVLPGPLGDPFVVTAHGGESRIRQTELRAGSGQKELVDGVSPRRIHMIRPGDAIGALHRGMGFPRYTLRSLDQQQVVVFEGASRLESGARTLRAEDGFLVVRRADGETGVVRGFGKVKVTQRREGEPELTAEGNDGLTLLVAADHERMHLGPPPQERGGRWRDHRYDVRYGKARLRGAGSCAVVRRDERIELELLAPFDEIQATFKEESTELRRVHSLRAALDGEQLAELDVAGLPVEATLQRGGERIHVQSPRLLQTGPRSLQLRPMPFDEAPWSELAELDRTPRLLRRWREKDDQAQPEFSVEVVGPRIDVHHAGGQNVLVEASRDGDDLPRIYALLPQRLGTGEATTVTCAADRLRILPFVLTPDVQRLHYGGMTGPLRDTLLRSLARPWLLVDRVRDFQLDDANEGHIEGTGDRLFLSQGGAAALFVGNADGQTPASVTRTHDGGTVSMQGARVRVFRDDAVRLEALGAFEDRSTFLAPTMTLHDNDQTGLLSHMRAICRGNIQIDPDAVRFGGPVVATGLLPDGEADPDGVEIDAEQLTMLRRATTRELVKVIGRNVSIDWSRLDARAQEITLDLLSSECTARDPKGADIVLPDGRRLRSRFFQVNYDTWSISMGRGRAVQESTGQEGEK